MRMVDNGTSAATDALPVSKNSLSVGISTQQRLYAVEVTPSFGHS